MTVWQLAHDGLARCLANCCRMVVAPRVSGSSLATSAGGGGGETPRMRSQIQWPRRIGDVLAPSVVTLSTLAWVSSPPRWLPGGRATQRSSDPTTGGSP